MRRRRWTEGSRTNDVYEDVPGYPKPPLVPVPDLRNLSELGVRPSRRTAALWRAATAVSGLDGFYRRLPDVLEPLLRRVPRDGLFGPTLSATIALTDDDRSRDPFERAATLLCGLRSLRDDYYAGTLPPDRIGRSPCEMGQYANLFGTSVVPTESGAVLYKSGDRRHLAVLVARRIYVLELGVPGVDVTAAAIADELRRVAEEARRLGRPPLEQSPGILTSARDGHQRAFFEALRADPDSSRSLERLRHTFATVCLELDEHPGSPEEAAAAAHVGHCENRWFLSSLQLVVFGNAKACTICSFTAYLDGNTMMRGSAEIQRRGARQEIGARPTLRRSGRIEPLKWRVDTEAGRTAAQDIGRLIDRREPATFRIHGLGAAFFRERGVDPIPGFVVALSLAMRALLGRPASIRQFLTMSKYRCMGLSSARVSTPEVLRFVELAAADSHDDATLHAALEAALASHDPACRRARARLSGVTLLRLFYEEHDDQRRWWRQKVLTVAMDLVRGRRSARPEQADVTLSHPSIHPETPIVGRPGIRLPYEKCFGLHYQILSDEIVATIMPSPKWSIGNRELAASLRAGLLRVGEMGRAQAASCGHA